MTKKTKLKLLLDLFLQTYKVALQRRPKLAKVSPSHTGAFVHAYITCATKISRTLCFNKKSVVLSEISRNKGELNANK